ncbi:MAG: SRPBCC family protein [Candidatus Promineifilaceae bacterium]|jgi:uncharacterized protein YndB with AHSA1/START domain
MLVRMSVDIQAPPEIVWPFLVVPEKTMQWFTALKKFEYTSAQQGGPGSTFYWYEEAGGRTYNLYFETTEWKENAPFAYRMTEGDFFKSYDERWEITKTPGGCRFTFNDHIEFPYGPLGKIIGLFAARTSQATGEEVLANLKRLAEAEAQLKQN